MNLSRKLAAASHRPLLLSLLAAGPKYGFQLVHSIQILSDEALRLPNSKLYPLLHSLEHDRLVESYWEPSESGPDRKYYRITGEGARALATLQSEWKWMFSMLTRVWDGEVAFS